MKQKLFFFRIIINYIFIFIIICSIGILTINFIVSVYYEKYIYTNINEIPINKVGVILGTSRFTTDNNPNAFFYNRINAAVKLYKNKKIENIIVSGDNSLKSYNEPREMYKVLVENGIPKKNIYLDFAGFRTLDSVIRTYKIFGQKSFTIISQNFHNRRALFIARKNNIKAIAFNADSVPVFYGISVRFRDFFARVKMFYDLYIINKKPKFLGEKIEIK